jgi:uridylate kinase
MNIIKYGGSKVSPTPETRDDSFIDSLIDLTRKYSEQEFMIIIGGGALAGKKQADEPDADNDRKDWLGIEATWENAQYVIKRFQSSGIEKVCPDVIKDPTQKTAGYRIYFAGGWKPGNSTDYVTMTLAVTYGAEKVIKISDFEVVKDLSPLEVKDLSKEERNQRLAEAEDLPEATWQKMVNLVGTEWVPRLNTPLDPLAAKLGLENSFITLYICQESQLEKVLSDDVQGLKGTVVQG